MSDSNSKPAVSFDKVNKSFGEKAVLKDVSFALAQGEALCLLGRSGMGKSVTLKLMIGLVRPDSGTICIQDQSIIGLDEHGLSQVRQQMGFLFQSAALFDSFSLHDNLALPLGRNKKIFGDEAEKRVRETLEEVGLGKDGGKMPAELSGGMRKRAGLARALILEPSILLIDEPSSGLDRITSSEIDNLLLDLKKKKKTTMVIVTHDVRGARRVGDRLAVLDGGAMVALGKPEELDGNENELVRALVSEEA